MSGILELMGATAGALALVDRLVDDDKPMRKNNPVKRRTNPVIRGIVLHEGDVFAHWLDPITRKLQSKQFTVAPQAIRHAKRMHAHGMPGAHAIVFSRGVANVIWEPDEVDMRDNPRGRSTGSVKRKSQATGKSPSKRLIARRVKTKRAPKGFFANPVSRGYDVAANGATIATFRTLAHAKEYGQAFADAHKTAVRIRKP